MFSCVLLSRKTSHNHCFLVKSLTQPFFVGTESSTHQFSKPKYAISALFLPQLRNRTCQEQQARESEQNDYAMMLREMQVVVSKERSSNQGLQSKLDNLNEALAAKEKQIPNDAPFDAEESKEKGMLYLSGRTDERRKERRTKDGRKDGRKTEGNTDERRTKDRRKTEGKTNEQANGRTERRTDPPTNQPTDGQRDQPTDGWMS